jgi:hypothetical protein
MPPPGRGKSPIFVSPQGEWKGTAGREEGEKRDDKGRQIYFLLYFVRGFLEGAIPMSNLSATSTIRVDVSSVVITIIGVVIAAAVIPGKANAVPILNPANGHYYEAIVLGDERDFLTWDAARIATESRMFMGRPGYLATITSKEENDFLIVNFAPVRSPRGELWVGGSDDPVDGEWRWVVGPEAGTLFWIGGPAGTEIVFADWAAGEPNNALGPASESRLGWSELGWNDLPASGFGSVKPGYIVEFSSIPEPSTFSLFSLALVGLGLIRQERNNRHLV